MNLDERVYGYEPATSQLAALREENARLRLLATDWDAKAMRLAEVEVERLTRERDEARAEMERLRGYMTPGQIEDAGHIKDLVAKLAEVQKISDDALVARMVAEDEASHLRAKLAILEEELGPEFQAVFYRRAARGE